MAEGRPGLAPQRGAQFFARPTSDFFEEVREAVRESVETASKKISDAVVREEVVKGKEREMAKGIENMEAELARSLNGALDVFEQHAIRNVFAVPDEIVFLDALADAKDDSPDVSAESYAEIDRLLNDIVSRQHLNHQLRQRIELIQSEMSKLEELERKINLGVMSFDATAFDRLAQHSPQLHGHMQVTEQELLKQGVPVPTKADEKKKDERAAAVQTSHQGIDDLLDLVNNH